MSEAVRLRIEHAGKRFPAADGKETVAVDDVTLDVAQGEFLVHRRAVGLRQDHGAQHARRACSSPTSGKRAVRRPADHRRPAPSAA